jgi:hypothetical protein
VTFTLVDAVEALNARKTTEYGGDETVTLPEQRARRVMVGLDLDYDELVEVLDIATCTLLSENVVGHADAYMTVSGAWLDGLLTGLLLAEGRARVEARAA